MRSKWSNEEHVTIDIIAKLKFERVVLRLFQRLEHYVIKFIGLFMSRLNELPLKLEADMLDAGSLIMGEF